MKRVAPLSKRKVKKIVKKMSVGYEDEENGAILVKKYLDQLKYTIGSLDAETTKKIMKMVSYKLKPLFLITLQSKDELEIVKAKGVYSVLRGYRGSLRQQLATSIDPKNIDLFQLTISAANDFKRAADEVVDSRKNEISRYYQRKNSSTLYHKGFMLYYKRPIEWEDIPDRTMFFHKQESYYNNKSFFRILRDFLNNPARMPNHVSEREIKALVSQTALYLANNTDYLVKSSNDPTKKQEFLIDQEHYTQEARDLGETYMNIQAHNLKKEIEAGIALLEFGFGTAKNLKAKGKLLRDIINEARPAQKEIFTSHNKTANKAMYHLE